MSRSPDHPGDPLRELRHAVVPVDGPGASADRRERTILRMKAVQRESHLQKEVARRLRKRLAVAAVVFLPSLAAAATWAAFHRTPGTPEPIAVTERHPASLRVRQGTVTVAHANGSTEKAVPGMPPVAFTPSDRVRTDGDAEASVDLPSGAAVIVSRGTELRVDAERASLERIQLASGRVDVKVPKLEPGRHLVVNTSDSAVVVHGTQFTVEASDLRPDGTAATTRVAVREGVVAVEHAGVSTELRAGDSWSSSEASPEAEAVPALEHDGVISATTPAVEDAVKPKQRAVALRVPSSSSSLALENGLMQRALAAAKAGDDARAVALLDDLITRYPSSPLEPNAEVEKLRALQRLGKVTQAAKQARRYLGNHPDGMGSEEARRIAVEPIAPSRGGSERSR